MTKRIGKIYEGRWKVVSYERHNEKSGANRYKLINIFNGEEMTICFRTMVRIDKGLTSISKYRRRKVVKEKKEEVYF